MYVLFFSQSVIFQILKYHLRETFFSTFYEIRCHSFRRNQNTFETVVIAKVKYGSTLNKTVIRPVS
jgi:hypothetical protein